MTEIALVGDLHGNLPATMALDADLKRRNIQRIWCLGDIVGKGPCSADTFDWAFSRCEIILQGNWDSGISFKQFPNDEFYYRQLGEKRMQALRDLPLEHHTTLSGRHIRLFHGRPVMKKLVYIQDDLSALSEYFEPDFQVVGYADAHRQGMRLVTTRGIIFNTGAVGNGMGLPMVQYAIMRGDENDPSAAFDLTFVTVPYDREQAVRDTLNATELPNADLLIKEIKTGIYARNSSEKKEKESRS